MRTHRHRDLQRGFTLIEMMVVVAIIGVLSAFLISVKSVTYGASPQSTAQLTANFFNTCKMRAVSTRRWHRCEVTPTTFTMMQWSIVGMTTPAGSCPTNCWQILSQTTFDKQVVEWMGVSGAGTTVFANPGVAVVTHTANTTDIDFRPDGSATGGTIFFSDPQGNKPWRTVVYKATGSSYARSGW